MSVEIINTSGREIPTELEEMLTQYAPYHIFEEQRNRIWIDGLELSYDILAIFVRLDKQDIAIWISDWFMLPRS